MQAEDLLKEHRLSRTKLREEMMEVFLESPLALSLAEIKEKLGKDCDRVTIYRNLKTFTEKGILHRVYLDKQDSKYILPESIVNPKKTYSEHLHFRCVNCEMLKCLTDQKILKVALPEGFKMLETNFVVYGICDDCNKEDSD